jgi:hypothetical protein
VGRVYRETTPAMLARVTAALDDRIGLAAQIAGNLLLNEVGKGQRHGLDTLSRRPTLPCENFL